MKTHHGEVAYFKRMQDLRNSIPNLSTPWQGKSFSQSGVTTITP